MSEIHSDQPPFDLRLEGDMTIYRAAELKPQILQAIHQHPSVHVDLSDVTDIDSAGLQLIYLAQREAERLGTQLRVVAYSQVVVGLMSSLNLLELLDRIAVPAAEALPRMSGEVHDESADAVAAGTEPATGDGAAADPVELSLEPALGAEPAAADADAVPAEVAHE